MSSFGRNQVECFMKRHYAVSNWNLERKILAPNRGVLSGWKSVRYPDFRYTIKNIFPV